MSNNDMINHPDHYCRGRFETIDVIDDTIGGQFEGYYIGNIVKYVSRYRHKNGIEDLKKGRWYLDRLISKLEQQQGQAPQEGTAENRCGSCNNRQMLIGANMVCTDGDYSWRPEVCLMGGYSRFQSKEVVKCLGDFQR